MIGAIVGLVLSHLRPFLLLVLGYLIYLVTRPAKPPPGFKSIPEGPEGHWLFGNAQLPLDVWSRVMSGWRKQYGDIYRFYIMKKISGVSFVVVNNVKTIKEILNNREFANRQKQLDGTMVLMNPTRGGILMPDSTPSSREMHKFVINVLSAFGFGRLKMEDKILFEADALVDCLIRKSKTAPVDPVEDIKTSIANSITLLVFNERVEVGEKSEIVDSIQTLISGFSYLLSNPLYATFPKLLNYYQTPTVKKIVKAQTHYDQFIADTLKAHERTFNEDDQRDFIDAYISERKKQPGAEHLDFVNFARVCFDLFAAGTDTTTHTMNWSIFWLLHHPDIYVKLRKEVLDIVGEDGVPTMGQLKDLHYLHAFMEEVYRRSCVADFAMFHRATKPVVEFGGFHFTDKDLVMPNIWDVHHDPALWSEPMTFKPERFLDTKGKFVNNENVIPFAVGTRRCIGEKLARLEQYIFTVRFIQRLKFRLPPGCKPPSTDGVKTLVRSTHPFTVIAEPAS